MAKECHEFVQVRLDLIMMPSLQVADTGAAPRAYVAPHAAPPIIRCRGSARDDPPWVEGRGWHLSLLRYSLTRCEAVEGPGPTAARSVLHSSKYILMVYW